MSTRNLEFLFAPRSVALIGASRREHSVGAVIARNLLSGGFEGPVLPVHPTNESVQGVLAYPDVDALPLVPDLAIIATPPETVPGLVETLGNAGTRAAVIISAGFSELADSEGQQLVQATLDAAKPHLMRLVGPNTLGVLAPNCGLNASFSHLAPEPGHLAFVTQSGAIVTSVIDWARPRGIGFSHLISLGGMLDVDFGDMLDYLANDTDTHAILLYMEGITHARKFMSAARAASRMKPVIVVKSGRHPQSAQAAASHTGALAGADDVYEAAFRRAGMLRVDSLEALFAATETLADIRPPAGDRLMIVTNGGGMGVLATDEVLSQGGHLGQLSEAALQGLDRVLPATWSRRNPVDVIGDATPERLADAVRELLAHPQGMDGLLVLNCPTAVALPRDAARSLVDCLGQQPVNLPVLTSWIGEETANEGRRILNDNGLPTYDTPGHAVRAFMQLVNYRRSQALLMESPPSLPGDFEPDIEAAQAIIHTALADGDQRWLSEYDAKRIFAAYGIDTVPTQVAHTPQAAAAAAASIGEPVVLKILSEDIVHKSDVGGVALNLLDGKSVAVAAQQMLQKVAEAAPEAAIEGFTIQPMVHRPGAYELIVGALRDRQFGAVLLFGHGGTAVEVINDRALGLPPLNLRLATEMIDRTRISHLLRGYRDHAAVDIQAIAMTLLRVSQLVVDFPEIISLDINPLLADESGVVALDARILLAPVEATDRLKHLAIRPYPKVLETPVTLQDSRRCLLRPIVPEDEPALLASFATQTPEEFLQRFLVPERTMTHLLAARFTQLDYDREMALVLTGPGSPGRAEVLGVVHLGADPDNERAEFAILVRDDVTAGGIGTMLMERIIAYAKSRGINTIWGLALVDNGRMRELALTLGFTETPDTDDPGRVRLELSLR